MQYRLCFLQCDWQTENSPQKAIKVNEGRGIGRMLPDALLSGTRLLVPRPLLKIIMGPGTSAMWNAWKLEAIRSAACVNSATKQLQQCLMLVNRKLLLSHTHTHTTGILQACTHTLYDNIDINTVTANHIACIAGVCPSLVLPQVGSHEV